ncbi:hypothetical protein [Streptomyces sp. NPDC093600]|uniref:hypothetical protein n=1 Tax=Streptomyces sp. NPDC093600 TaxID=3366047 RepID=UPI00381FE622
MRVGRESSAQDIPAGMQEPPAAPWDHRPPLSGASNSSSPWPSFCARLPTPRPAERIPSELQPVLDAAEAMCGAFE